MTTWPTAPRSAAIPGPVDETQLDDPEGEIVDAHLEGATPLREIAGSRRPVIHRALRHPTTAPGHLADWADRHDLWFHALRFWWLYWAKLAFRAPVTVSKAVSWAFWVILDVEGYQDLKRLRQGAKDKLHPEGAVAKAKAARRWQLAARAGTGLLIVVVAWSQVSHWAAKVPLWALAAGLYVGLPALGWPSRPLDEAGRAKIAGRRTRAVYEQQIRADRIVEALAGLGIAKLTRAIEATDGQAVGFLGEVHRTRNDIGIEVDVILPVSAKAVIRRAEEFAAALQVPQSTVFLSHIPDSPANFLHVFIAFDPIAKREPKPWRYLRKGEWTNFFEPVEIGEDEQGNPVFITLFEAAILIGAMPGAGKTWTQRVIALACALDVRTELHVWNYKGGADWRAFEKIAHAYGSSARVDDIAPMMLADFKALRKEIERRQDAIEAAFPRFHSEKLTDQMAMVRELGLHPIAVFVDEIHWANLSAKWGALFKESEEDFVRRGRACGILFCGSTQKPSSLSIPTDMRDNVSHRIGLRMLAQTANDMVFGTGAWKLGIRTNTFPRKARGMALVLGEEDEPTICRVPPVSGDQCADLVERIYERKVREGWLSGMAAGQSLIPDDETSASTLEDLIGSWPVDGLSDRADKRKRRITTEAAVELLAARDATRYGGWSTGQLTMELGKFRLSTDPKHIDAATGTKRGIDYAELLDALDAWVLEQQALAEAANDPEPVSSGVWAVVDDDPDEGFSDDDEADDDDD